MTTWHPTTPAWYLETAERVCTPKQLEVLQLASHELTDQQIAYRLGITRQAVQQRRLSGSHSIACTAEAARRQGAA
jgi:DNA-binding NarL/FixJ family response regulator